MNLLEGARAGAGLLGARATGLLAHHAALADEDDVAVRELLLELVAGCSGVSVGGRGTGDKEGV